MSKCQFDYPISQLAQFIGVSQLLPKQKGSFSGDERSGRFEIFTPVGNIVGDYECNNEQIQVFIRNKPFIVPCVFIQKELNKLLGN